MNHITNTTNEIAVDDRTIARVIHIEPELITIDGKPFPYVVLSEKINVTIDPEGICTVYLPIYADRVELETPAALQ